MRIDHTENIAGIHNLELLARQVVEGFITGMHKSPFHGFSVEFAEHRLYNKGESTRDIDWKLFAKTDKLFVKRYEEETNLRCQLIIDDSASMYYPERENKHTSDLNKIGFSVVATAALLEILKGSAMLLVWPYIQSSWTILHPQKAARGTEECCSINLNNCWLRTDKKKPTLFRSCTKLQKRSTAGR